MRKKIKNAIINLIDKIVIHKKVKNEVLKFKDVRRAEIYNKVNLTNKQKKKIDDFYLENYGKKIPYTWHKHFTAFTGKFDYKYFPEMLYIPKFEYYMNKDKYYCNALSDKNFLNILFSKHINMPKIIIYCINGLYFDGESNFLTKKQLEKKLDNLGVVFAKPTVETGSGKNCFLMNVKNSIDLNTKQKVFELLSELGSNWVIQEKIQSSKSLVKIYSGSINTFRIISYVWNNQIVCCPVILRIGQGGSYLDNAHAGGMFIAVNNDGKLHEKAFTEFKKEYLQHPDSLLKFKNYKIANFPRVMESVIKLHSKIPQVGIINWDFTIDIDENPVLIEANTGGGSIWLLEMAHGKSCFGDDTAEILQWIRKWIKQKKQKDSKGNFI